MGALTNKLIFTFLFSLHYLIALGQSQRIAVLPYSMNYGDTTSLKSISIDYLRAEPIYGTSLKVVIAYESADDNLARSIDEKYKVLSFGNANIKIKDLSGNNISARLIEPLLVSENHDQINPRFWKFIKSKISACRNSNFDVRAHANLQIDIWQYNILDILAYINGDNDDNSEYDRAVEKFRKDFPDINGVSQILALGKALKSYDDHNNGKLDEYIGIFIRRSSSNGDYIVFKGADKPIYRGRNENELANVLEAISDKFENVHLFLENFSTRDDELLFLSKIRKQLEFQEKNLGVTEVPKNGIANILLVDVEKLELRKKLRTEEINQIKYNDKNYYCATISFETKDQSSISSVKIMSTKKTVVDDLLNRTARLFSETNSNVNLKLFFNKFKKDLKKTSIILKDDEFVVILNPDVQNIRIV